MGSSNKYPGKITLRRTNEQFIAAYSFVRDPFPELLQYGPLLHVTELQHYHSLKAAASRASYLLGRASAKWAIAGLTQEVNLSSICIKPGVFQFPVVTCKSELNIQTSISHCSETGAALAFPEAHPMGIDLEKAMPDKMEALKEYISPKEEALLEKCGLPPLIGYNLLWTVKEGLSKVLKTGLMIEFTLLAVDSLQKSGAAYLSTFQHLHQYKAISFCCNDYACSIILPRNTQPELEDFHHSFMQAHQA